MEEGDVFEIEKILETSLTENIRWYLVRWKGYGENDDTWEPEENLHDCEEVLKAFWKGSNKQKKKQVRKRKNCEPVASTSTTSVPKQQKRGRRQNHASKRNNCKSSIKKDEEGWKIRTRNALRTQSGKKTNNESVCSHGNVSDDRIVQEDEHLKTISNMDGVSDPLHCKELFVKDTAPVTLLCNTTNRTDVDQEQLTTPSSDLDNTSNINFKESANLVQCNESEKLCEKSKVTCDTSVSVGLEFGPSQDGEEFLTLKDKQDCEAPEDFEKLSEKTPLTQTSIDNGKSGVEFQKILYKEKSRKDTCEEEESIRTPCKSNTAGQQDNETCTDNEAEQLCHQEKLTPDDGENKEFVSEEEELLNEETELTSMDSTEDLKKAHGQEKNDEIILKQDNDVLEESKPDISRIFDNLQKIKKKIALKPLPDDPKSKTEPFNVDISLKCLSNHSTSSVDVNEPLRSTGNSVQELANSPKKLLENHCCLSPVIENSFLEDVGTRKPRILPTVDKKPCNESLENIDENNSFTSPVVEKYSPENMEQNSADDLEKNHLCDMSLAVENFSLKKFGKNKPYSLNINENSFPENTKKNSTKAFEKPISGQLSPTQWRTGAGTLSPDETSSVDSPHSPDSNLEQSSKQPQIISISDDSDETDGETERKRTSNTSRNFSKYGHHYRWNKGRATATETLGSKDQKLTKTLDNDIDSGSNCDVVSQIIESSSLNASEVKGKQNDLNSQEKDSGVEKRDSDMDLCDSDFEFDLDDYNPVELLNEKSVRVNRDPAIKTGIPTAISLRDVKQAIKKGDTGTILASLAGGLDVESQDGVVGMTLLMRAVSAHQDGMVRLLIGRGANVNARDNAGNTPLMMASEQGFSDIACLLLDAEADVNAKQSSNGETALIKACKKGFYEVVSILVAYGADCQIRSLSGLTAYQWAAHRGQFEIRDLLDSHNKKLQNCVEKTIIGCLGHASYLIHPPLLPYVCLYPNEGQKFIHHFNCTNLLWDKTILLYCFRAVFSRNGEVDLSFSRDNGVHTITLNGLLQSPILRNNRSVFKLHPKLDTNRLVVQTYQSHVHLLVCIYAAELNHDFLRIEDSSVMV